MDLDNGTNHPLHVIIIFGSDLNTLGNCIKSLLAEAANLVCTLVNNSSLDCGHLEPLVAQLNCRIIDNKGQARGFAYNNNLAVRTMPLGADIIMFLNDDTVMEADSICAMRQLIESDPKIAAVGPVLYNTDGSVQSAKRYYPHGLRAGIHALLGPNIAYVNLTNPRRYWLSGACLMVRREAFDQVGRFDERFDPGYGEDVDLCWRFTLYNWKVKLCDQARVVHLGGMSFGKNEPWRHKVALRGVLRYNDKWMYGWQKLFFRFLWGIGIIARLCVSAILNVFFPRKHMTISPQYYIEDLITLTTSEKQW